MPTIQPRIRIKVVGTPSGRAFARPVALPTLRSSLPQLRCQKLRQHFDPRGAGPSTTCGGLRVGIDPLEDLRGLDRLHQVRIEAGVGGALAVPIAFGSA